jgi:DNA adenine methylase
VQAGRIREASQVLSRAAIHNEDFEYILEVAEPGDLVYFDPPYKPMSATANFAEYSAEGFGQEDQERLLRTVTELDEQGVQFILSNSGVMFELYDDAGFIVEREGATRSINSDETARGEVDEIIATNVPNAEREELAEQTSFADL